NILAKMERIHLPGAGVFTRMKQTVEDVGKQIDTAATTQSTRPATQEATVTIVAPRGPVAIAATQPAMGSSSNPMWVLVGDRPKRQLEQLRAAATLLLGPLGTAGVVLVITIFMLLSREDLRDRTIRLIGRGQITVTTQALDDAATRISRYLVMQSLINGIYG